MIQFLLIINMYFRGMEKEHDVMARDMIKRILQNPNEVYQEMLYNNEEFRRFVEENKDKTIEQMLDKYNIEL